MEQTKERKPRPKHKILQHQQKLLEYIDAFVKQNGFSPTAREMTKVIGYKPKSYGVVQSYIQDLIAKGFLIRVAGAKTLKLANPLPYWPYYPPAK